MKTLLLSNENSAARIIKALKGSTEIVVGLVKTPNVNEHPLQAISRKANLNCWLIDSLGDGDLKSRMTDSGIDLLLTFRFPRIVPSDLISLPRMGAYNLHTGPLPAYAGLNVASWAIFNGETSHGVTLHRLATGIDTGDIVMADTFPIDPGETGISLTGKCVRSGTRLMVRLVERLLARDPPDGQAQNLDERRYYSKRSPGDGRIDWTWDVATLERLVRASYFHPFPSPWGTPLAKLCGVEFGVLKAAAVHGNDREPGSIEFGVDGEYLDVAAADGILRIYEVSQGGSVISLFRLCRQLERELGVQVKRG